MAVIVRDSIRKLPIQSITNLEIGLDDLFEALLELKRANCPEWTDESTSDFGIHLLWLFAVLEKWLADNINRVSKNSYIGTATDRESMRALCELINYQMSEAGAASVTITFTCSSGHPGFTIPKGTQVTTEGTTGEDPIIFETSADIVVGTGVTSISGTCVEGISIPNEVLGSSNGTTGQSFILDQFPVVWQSETLEVNEGSGWVEWTRQDDFSASDGDDKHYLVKVDEDGYYYIHFGNGTNGKIPVRGTNNIRVSYRKGGGIVGNVGAGAINSLVSAISYVESVTNISAASGGTNRETLDHARIFGPANIKALNRIVTTADAEALAESYVSTTHGGIAKAKAYEIGTLKSTLMIVPRAGGNPSSGLVTELQSYIDARRMICTTVTVSNPNYISVNITATIYALPGYSSNQVGASVVDAIYKLMSPTYQDPETGLYPHDFGQNINLSDLYSAIDSAVGVKYVNISLPAENITINDYAIATPGTISLTIQTGDGDVSYFNYGE